MSKEKKPTKPSLNKNTLKTAKRLLGYVTKTYKVQFIIVLNSCQFDCDDLGLIVAEVSAG